MLWFGASNPILKPILESATPLYYLTKQKLEFALHETAIWNPVSNRRTDKVISRYQTMIPRLARKALELETGNRLFVDVQDGILVLVPQLDTYTDGLAGFRKELWKDVDAADYLAREREA